MNRNLHRDTGLLFIAGAALLFIPYIMLVFLFDYPDILRMPVDRILSKFHDGGTLLIWVWWAFSLAGLPLFWAAVYLRRVMGDEYQSLRVATILMLIGGITQIAGLLRWVFVVPVLSDHYAAHADTSGEVVSVIFLVVHQYGGVALGEHLGQLFSIIWTSIVSFHVIRTMTLPSFIGWFGLVSAVIYFFGQTELFATVIPDFPVISWAAPAGSTLWLLWMILLGVSLIRRKPSL